MFNKMITYNGDEEPPVLCLNAEIIAGKPMKVYLTRSWFFLDADRFVGDPNNNITRRGIVGDATVEMQVNDGEWQRLTFVAVKDTMIYGHRREGRSFYTINYAAHAGDKVTIRASHPDYKTVTATEIVPPKPLYESTITPAAQLGKVVPVNIAMEALPTATKDQIMFFSVTGFGHLVDTSLVVERDYTQPYVYSDDTLLIVESTPVVFQRIYSEDFMFSEFDLPRTTHNYYTQNGPLYTSADHFVEPKNVTILLDCAKWSYNGSPSDPDTLEIEYPFDEGMYAFSREWLSLDSVVVNVRLSNESFYMYRTTVYGKRLSTSAPEISLYDDSQGSDDYGDIFEEIAELFSELGNQEGTQVYTNVEGGFGHLSFLNQTMRIFPMHIIWSNINNDSKLYD